MQREDPAHRSGFAFCFRISSSTPWPIEMKIRTVHVPRPSPCTVLLGPCSRWTAEEEMRKKRDLYRTEISVEGPNLAGLQHDVGQGAQGWALAKSRGQKTKKPRRLVSCVGRNDCLRLHCPPGSLLMLPAQASALAHPRKLARLRDLRLDPPAVPLEADGDALEE